MADTSGDEGCDRLRPLSYLDCDLVLLCVAMNSTSSLKSISEKWKAEIKWHLPKTPIILVGTKGDLFIKEQQSEQGMTEEFCTIINITFTVMYLRLNFSLK